MAKEQPSRKLIGIRVQTDLVRDLKILALKIDKPTNALLEEAIKDVLKKYGTETQ